MRVKQFYIKKNVNKILQDRRFLLSEKKIKTIGVLLTDDNAVSKQLIAELSAMIGVGVEQVQVLLFAENKKTVTSLPFFCAKDISWNAKIKSLQVQNFIQQPFDILVNYYSKNNLELQLVSALSHANFKVGIYQDKNQINDFVIKTNVQQPDIFITELKKYLNIFNKI